MNLEYRVRCGAGIAACTKLEKGLREIAHGGERREVLPPIIDRAATLADEVFVFDASPDGTPWIEVKKLNGEALEESGAMRASKSVERGPYQPNGFFIVIEYGDAKARHHHYGTKHGGPISDDARKPFHPKMRRNNRWENIRKSSYLDSLSGRFGQAEREHIPARPLLPIGDIQAPRWVTALEETWLQSFTAWMQKGLGF